MAAAGKGKSPDAMGEDDDTEKDSEADDLIEEHAYKERDRNGSILKSLNLKQFTTLMRKRAVIGSPAQPKDTVEMSHDYSTRTNDQPPPTKFVQADYVDNTPIKLDKDIYDLVIGANVNRIFTPIEERYAIGQCMLCFMIQIYAVYAFVSDSLTFDNF